MADKKDEGTQGPLSSEALKRDEWRGDGAPLKSGDAPGHTLPESESAATDAGEDRASEPAPLSGTMLPPD